MYHKSKAKPARSASGYKSASDCKFVDRNLKEISPLREQFEPTEQVPISQRKRMAGYG